MELDSVRHSCERVKVVIEDLGGGKCWRGKRVCSRGKAGGMRGAAGRNIMKTTQEDKTEEISQRGPSISIPLGLRE
jgi:hypothetical protein